MAEKKKSPLYTGKKTYIGKMTIEEAFQRALEPYFSKMGYSIKIQKKETNEPE